MNLPLRYIRINRHCYMYLPLKDDFSFNLLIKEGLLRGLRLLNILTGIYKSSESPLFIEVSCDDKGQNVVINGEIYAVYGDNPCDYKVYPWKMSRAGVNLCNTIPR